MDLGISWIDRLNDFWHFLYHWKYQNMVFLSFEHLQKIRIFPKSGGRSSKIEPAMPISILNFQRVWQPYFLCHTLQILIKHGFFTDKQMMFYRNFCISDRIPTIFRKLIFFLWQWPPNIQKSDFCILGGHCQRKKTWFLKIVGILSEIQESL